VRSFGIEGCAIIRGFACDRRLRPGSDLDGASRIRSSLDPDSWQERLEALAELTTVRRLFATSVLALGAFAIASAAWTGLRESHAAWRRGHGFRHQTREAIEDRIFGREYMAAVREIRRRVPARSTVLLIDEQRREGGAAFFALHYLAPRRIRKLVTTGRTAEARAARRRVEKARWVVVVRDFPTPLELEASSRPRRRRR
jgi:hypothetical protein